VIVSVWLLVPAAACVLALGVLTIGLQLISRAAAELSTELRRSSATAVAGDELIRAASNVGDHAEQTRATADRLKERRPGPPKR